MDKKLYEVSDFYAFKVGPMWSYFKGEHFSFWMICGYLFFEFVRPQAIFPVLDFMPWAQSFLLGAVVGMFLDSTIKHVPSVANVFVLLFLVAISISVVTAIYPGPSKKNYSDFFSWIVVYFLISRIVNSRERFYLFILIYILAAGKIAIGTSKVWAMRGFSFAGWGLTGPRGYFENSGELAILMVMLFPLAFYLYQNLKNKVALWERVILLAFWVCPILTVLGASSRGAQVALVVQLALMFRKSIFKLKPLIGIVFLVSSLILLLPEEQKARFTEAGEDKTSQQRLLYWEHGWEMMKDYPLSGVGFYNFIPYYEAHYSYDMLYPTAQLPHNIFIQVGTDAGFVALSFFIIIILYCLIAPLRIIKRSKNDEATKGIAAGLGVGVLGFLIAGQFVTVAYYPFLWVHLAFIVAFSNIFEKKDS